MFFYLLLLFIAVPCVEIYLLVRVGQVIGAAGTVALILLTGLLGAALARHEGIRALHRIRAALAQGILPTQEVLDGFLILAAGLVLITPGLITDALGFLLLAPPARALIRNLLVRFFRARFHIVMTERRASHGFGHPWTPEDEDTIETTARPPEDD
jgi:UPF0716 protein FxsA